MAANNIKWIAAGVAAICLLTGCGSENQKEVGSGSPNQERDEVSGMKTSIETKEIEQRIIIDFQVENTNEEDMNLTFPNGLQADYILFDDKGEKLSQHSENMFSTQAITEKLLPGGETLNYEFVVEGLPNGSYSIEAFLTAKELDETAKADFEVSASPFVKETGELAASDSESAEIRMGNESKAYKLSAEAAAQLSSLKEGDKVDFISLEDSDGNPIIERFQQ